MPNFDKITIPANVKALVVPVVSLIVLIGVFYFVFNTGISKIKTQSSTLASQKTLENILTEKKRIISDFSTNSLIADTFPFILPDRNPALMTISQLRKASAFTGLTIKNIKIGSVGTIGNLSFVDISYRIEGPAEGVFSYLINLKKYAPIYTLEKAKFSNSTGIMSLEKTMKVYFAPFPQKLTALTEGVKDFTSEEKKLIDNFSTFILPTVGDTTTSFFPKTNPFQ